MKKIVLALCLLLGSSGSLLAQTPTKLGHVDRQALMLMLPERKDAEKKIQDFAASLDNRLKAMMTEYETKVQDANQRAQSGDLTQTEQQAIMRELQELEQRISNAREKAEEDLAKMQEELLAPMVKRIGDAIKAVADEKHYTYVFDTSTGMVVYFDKGEDLLLDVKKKLNIP